MNDYTVTVSATYTVMSWSAAGAREKAEERIKRLQDVEIDVVQSPQPEEETLP